MCGCMGCESVCGSDWAWVWDLLSSGLLGLPLMGGRHCLTPLLAASPACGHIWIPGALGQGRWGRRWPTVWLSGALGPLGYWVGPLPGGLGALGLLGPGSGALPMSGRLGPGGVGGSLPLVPGGPLPRACGGSFRGLPLRSSGWMRGCPCGGLPGFCAPWGLLVAWVFWPSQPASDCWGGAVDCGSVHLYTHC